MFVLKPPKEALTKKIWKLNATMYGFCDAPRAWYLSIEQELIKTGGTKNKYDGAIFYWYSGSKLLSSHVGNFFWAGNKLVFCHLRMTFLISKEEIETFKYLGLQTQLSKNGIEIHQKKFKLKNW